MNIKRIEYGNYSDIYVYRNHIRFGSRQLNVKKSSKRSEEYKQRSRHRAINNIVRLIDANFDASSYFLTFTFDPERTKPFDRDYVQYSIRDFIKRVKVRYGEFRYLYVLEKHKSGAYHIHMVCNLYGARQKTIERLWRHRGWVKKIKLYEGVRAGLYLAKYLHKASADLQEEKSTGEANSEGAVLNSDGRRSWTRTYFASRNLIKPKITYYDGRQTVWLTKVVGLRYINSYYSDLYGLTKVYRARNK